MTKSRDFSVRLLVESYNINNIEDAFKDNVKRDKVINENNGKGYKIDIKTNIVWWSTYFDIEKLYNNTNSFLYFIDINNRVLVFSFGYGFTKIKEDAFEEQFGFKITLNALDSEKIKSVDVFNPSNNTKQKRIVSSILTNIYDYEYNDNNDFIENISGVVKEKYKDIFKNPTGKNSLKISTKYQKDELIILGKTLLELYFSDEYKKDELFKDINKIKKATQKETENLNNKFNKILKSNDCEKIFISDKDILEPDSFFCYKIEESKDELDNITFDDIKNNIKNLDVETLKKKYIKVFKNSDDKNPISWKIFDCLVFDLEYENKKFYLSKGIWYEIDSNFIKNVEENFNNYLDNSIHFIDFTDEHNEELRIGKEYYRNGEAHYNYKVSQQDENLILFDKKIIKLKNYSKLEICDLYDKKNHIFYHIKRGNESPSLSHLWNQGLISEEVCRINEIEEYKNSFNKYGGIPENRQIYYGIIYDKKDIPIFSKISFYNIIRSFKLCKMDKNIKVFFINDKSTNKKTNKNS